MNSPAPSEPICNNAALRRAARRLGQLYDDVLAPSGLRATQHALLSQIDRADRPTMRALADALVMDLSALGHTLKPLARDGYVELVPDENDRRSRRVSLTTSGKSKLKESRALWSEAQARFEASLGQAEASALRGVLNRIASPAFASGFTEPGASAGKTGRTPA
ncbi:MarR family winged helix-turn-helix transcriptional regulator [Cupriavidus sp. 2TAF22]|uniref:MarR family winged helix-turn-helix transcriptional regulator n=1 Tax=unclassified Cupriavidus TaxID=2640874 RepID=UPI003F91962D